MEGISVGDTIFTVDFMENNNNKYEPMVYRNNVLRITNQMLIVERCDGRPIILLSDSELALKKGVLPLFCKEEIEIHALVGKTIAVMEEKIYLQEKSIQRFIGGLNDNKELYIKEFKNRILNSLNRLNANTVALFLFDIEDRNVIRSKTYIGEVKKIDEFFLIPHPIMKDEMFGFTENQINRLMQVELMGRFSYCVPLKYEYPISERTVRLYAEEILNEATQNYSCEILSLEAKREHLCKYMLNPPVNFYEST